LDSPVCLIKAGNIVKGKKRYFVVFLEGNLVEDVLFFVNI